MIVDSTIRQLGLAAVFVITCAMLFCATATAGTRVLVRFDESGHYAHLVHRSESTSTQSALTSATAQAATNSEVSLRWLDSNGNLLAATRVIDPRITHAPLEPHSTEFAWVVLEEGAYLVSGPDSAVQLEILLPGRNTPNVPTEIWLLDLK
ncbi:MAG: hypothetical protein V3U65_05370 [Granulosicoccaceae bacterium]